MHFDLFQEKFGLGIPRTIYSEDKSPESLEPQQMSQRGMNLAYMAADSHFFSFRSHFLTGKKKRRKKPHK